MYDIVFITHLPAFYKITLYNEIAQHKNICAIFVGKTTSHLRSTDFTFGDLKFPSFFLTEKEFEKRNKIASITNLIKLLLKIKFKTIIIGGWDLPEFWITNFLSQGKKLNLALESTINESSLNLKSRILKRTFLKKISKVYVSGSLHKELLKKLKFRGEIKMTYGVGLINKIPYKVQAKESKNTTPKRFLYVGRLSKVKNLQKLCEAFVGSKDTKLSIIGAGPLQNEVENYVNKSANISLIPHVPNYLLKDIYLSHEVFILPSTSETWGLVIEEALWYKLPILVSDKVGCGPELVLAPQTGIIFKVAEKEGLKNAINEIRNPLVYKRILDNVFSFDLNEKDQKQVDAYLK